MDIRGSLSHEEISTFLENATIPIRIGCRMPDDTLWMLSLWFRYQDGRFQCATSQQADVVTYLEYDQRIAFEVSTNDPPYTGVRGHGSATVTEDPDKQLLRKLLDRYLDDTNTALGRRLLDDDRQEVTITINPERVFGWDFTERMNTG